MSKKANAELPDITEGTSGREFDTPKPPKEPAPPIEPAAAPKTGRLLSAELGDQFTLTHRDGGEFLLRVTKTGNKRIELELDPRDCIKRITKEI